MKIGHKEELLGALFSKGCTSSGNDSEDSGLPVPWGQVGTIPPSVQLSNVFVGMGSLLGMGLLVETLTDVALQS